MYSDLKKEISNLNILRIILLFFAVSFALFLIGFFLSATSDITFFSESGDTLFKFFMVISLVSSNFLVYIAISVFFRNNVLSKISMFADNRLGVLSYGLYGKANKVIFERPKIFKDSSAKTYLYRRCIVGIASSGFIVSKEFKSSNVSGLIITLKDEKFHFYGDGVILDSMIYENIIDFSEYRANSSTISNFSSYFSNREMEEKIRSSNVLNAINQIKSAYNKNICISFMDDTVYIIIEGEKLQSNFNDENVMKLIEQTKSIMSLYDALI